MQRTQFISAHEAKQRVVNGNALSKNKKRQTKLLNHIIDVFYRKINKAISKGNLEIEIEISYTTGVLFTNKYWNYHFNELSNESREYLSDFFESKGFDVSFPGLYGLYIDDSSFVHISWEDI